MSEPFRPNQMETTTNNNPTALEPETKASKTTAPKQAQQRPSLYITVGPPCSGKTTWVVQNQIIDVALDDQPGIYEPIPTAQFLEACCWNSSSNVGGHNNVNNSPTVGDSNSGNSELPNPSTEWTVVSAPRKNGFINSTEPETTRKLRKTTIFGRSLWDRIRSPDQRELCLLLQRLALKSTAAEFACSLQQECYPNTYNNNNSQDNSQQGDSSDMANCSTSEEGAMSILIQVVEEILSQKQQEQKPIPKSGENSERAILPPWLPPTVDLFVKERIFKASMMNHDHNQSSYTMMTGLEAAHFELEQHCRKSSHHHVAWGNTNTRPREYQQALQLAAQTQRPVHFVMYNQYQPKPRRPSYDEEDGDDVVLLEEDVFDLPHLDFPQLLRRNIHRFLLGGRYVPANVIWDMCQRTSNAIDMVVNHWRRKRRISRENNEEVDAANDASLGRGREQGSHENKFLESQQQSLANKSTATQDCSNRKIKKLSKFEFDRILVQLANFDMNDDRTVVSGYRPLPATSKQRAPAKQEGDNWQGTRRRQQQQWDNKQQRGAAAGPSRPWDKQRQYTPPRPYPYAYGRGQGPRREVDERYNEHRNFSSSTAGSRGAAAAGRPWDNRPFRAAGGGRGGPVQRPWDNQAPGNHFAPGPPWPYNSNSNNNNFTRPPPP